MANLNKHPEVNLHIVFDRKILMPTVQNMKAIAEFNTIVRNYLKMKKLLEIY